MKKLLSRAFCALFPLVTALIATGCGEFEVVDPIIEISEKRTVAVVPFRDTDFDNGFDSPRGTEIAWNVVNRFRDRGDFKVVSKEKILSLYDPATETHAPTAREVALKTTADYVLMADVVHWQVKDEDMNPGGLLRGMALIDVSIYETYDAALERAKSDKEKAELPDPGRGRIVVAKKRVKAVFPREYGLAGVGTMEMTPEQVEDGLKLAAAQQVAWLLVSHSKDEEKKAEGK